MKRDQAVLRFRHPISRQGWPCDQLVSLLQKAIRRGQCDLAMAAFSELVVMVDLFPGEANAKRLRTQAVNRLSVIAMEDIGMGDPALVLRVLLTCLPMTRSTRRKEFDWSECVACIQAMCAAKKTRVTSWLYHSYGVEENREQAIEAGIDVYPVDFTSVSLNDPNCFQCIDAGASTLMWKRLWNSPLWPRLTTTLQAAYAQLSAGSKRACLALALAIHYYEVAEAETVWLPVVDQTLIERLQRGDYAIEMLDGVLDKHTAQGRASGKTTLDFRREGTRVFPEDESYKGGLEEIYRNSKRL